VFNDGEVALTCGHETQLQPLPAQTVTILLFEKRTACLHSASVFWLLFGSLQKQSAGNNARAAETRKRASDESVNKISFEIEQRNGLKNQQGDAG
jgi:hypothetical protein